MLLFGLGWPGRAKPTATTTTTTATTTATHTQSQPLRATKSTWKKTATCRKRRLWRTFALAACFVLFVSLLHGPFGCLWHPPETQPNQDTERVAGQQWYTRRVPLRRRRHRLHAATAHRHVSTQTYPHTHTQHTIIILTTQTHTCACAFFLSFIHLRAHTLTHSLTDSQLFSHAHARTPVCFVVDRCVCSTCDSFAKSIGAIHQHTSAQQGKGLDEVFTALSRAIIAKQAAGTG
jgi:hypothetical protein